MLGRIIVVLGVAFFVCSTAVPANAADPGGGDLCVYKDEVAAGPDVPGKPAQMVPCTNDGHPWSGHPQDCWYEKAPVDGNIGPTAFTPKGRRVWSAVMVAARLRGAVVQSPVPPDPAPDPPGTLSMPRGHDYAGGPEPGMWVRCWAAPGGLKNAYYYTSWWITTGGGVDPAALARQSVGQLGIQAPLIGMTGGSPPDGMQIVGLPAWMWITNPGPQTTGTVITSVSDGGTSVTLTGTLDRTVWSMGDGSQVTCKGSDAPYLAYDRKYWNQPSPSCGYMYTKTSAGQPNLAYTVTVTAYWTITWQSGDGQSGTIPFSISSSIPKQVGQIETIVTEGGS